MLLEYIHEEGVHQNAREFRYVGGKHGVLITHGLSGSLFHYREVAELLAKEGLTVYGVRLPGHGTHPDDLRYVNVRDFQNRIDSALEEMLKTCEMVSMFGGSFGGNLLLDAAHRHAGNKYIHRIVVLDMPVVMPRAWLYRPFLWLMQYTKTYYQKSWTKNDKRDGKHFTEHGSYVYMPFHAIREFHRFIQEHTKKHVDGVTQPVLIIQSVNDKVVLPRGAKKMQKKLCNAHVEMRWINSDKHVPLMDLPKQFHRMIVRFMLKDLY